jgi:acyl-CoA synthetase (AMP-forming)/AMP-acid ligase II
MASRYDEIQAQLTGPGGPFEIGEEDVLGERMPVFTKRMRSLRELLAASAAHGAAEYIVVDDRRIGYAEHVELVARAARAFAERYGIRKGDRVAILAENHPEWIVSFWATVSSGAVVAALNGWWTEDEIRYGLELSRPKLLIADRKRLARLGARPPGLPVVEIESDFAALLEGTPPCALPDVPIAEDDPAVILFTSGTTGRPKGAVGTHRGILGFVQGTMLGGLRAMLLAAEDKEAKPLERPPTAALVTVPLFHMSGLYANTVMMLAVGAKTVWRLGKFDPLDVLRIIERERITSWAGLGSMAPRVLNHPDVGRYDLSSIRNLGSGGAPTSPTLQSRMRAVAPNGRQAVGLGYGSSESVSVVAVINGAELEEHPTSVGRPQPCHQVEIRDAEGRALPEGQEGEIFVRGPFTMLGYWGNPEATAKAILPGRWLATGDIGTLRDGRLYINSRARDMILRGAENVYPVEIEHRIEEHPAVVEAAVIGVDHPELGQEVKAIVVPANGAPDPDPRELAAWVGEKLAPYKVPAHWEIRREPLPRNAAGKVLKTVLRGESENSFIEE